jgi:ABC-2 type transport system ATP-binding protein
MNGPPALLLERLSRIFPAAGARGAARGQGAGVGLRELSVVVERGQIAALAGPNGCGKTTALRIISTLVRPSSGRALVYGLNVVAEPARVRHLIGVSLGAGRSFYWRLTALQNLTFFARLRGVRRGRFLKEIPRLAAELDFERYLGRPARTLSRGTLARIAVARACVGEPELLVLDEPFASVDGRSRALLWSALERRARAGSTAILATHDESVRDRCSLVTELQ